MAAAALPVRSYGAVPTTEAACLAAGPSGRCVTAAVGCSLQLSDPRCLYSCPTPGACTCPLAHLLPSWPSPSTPATAYFVFLGMLAVVACVEPAAARYFSDWWSEHELEIRLPKLPVVLKVGGQTGGRPGRLLLPVHACCCCCHQVLLERGRQLYNKSTEAAWTSS